LRDVWVLNRQVKDDDNLLDPHYIKDVAVETNATIFTTSNKRYARAYIFNTVRSLN
jgi:hypothetical protein